jgi:iron complex outermembrane receptor protein
MTKAFSEPHRLAFLAALLSVVAFIVPAHAESVTFSIDPQDLSGALKMFAVQSHREIFFAPELTRGKTSKGVKGTYDDIKALKVILEETGLNFSVTASNAILVRDPADKAASSQAGASSGSADDASSSKEAGKKSSQDFRVAQVDQGTAGPQVGKGKKEDESDSKKKTAGLEEIIVTGSRIPTAAGQQTVPVRSYTREDIERSGQSTMGEFLNTLPDVSNFAFASAQLGFAGQQTVQLHGLPIGSTVTLLDGRRLETNTSGFFDLGNIPLAAVERIEILPVGASAVYGSDALGGAVNTILRKDFNGFEANATLEHASGVNDPNANLAWGKSWARGSVSLIGSYQERGELLGAQREPWSLTSLPASLPASTVSLFGSDSCAPGNVYSPDGSNLPGLSSAEAAIPAGITGIPTLQQFVATAGKQNVCSAGRYVDITPQSQREGALLSAHYNVTESIDIFTEVLYSHQHLRNQIAPQIQLFQGSVAANNPYNPFGEAVNVSFTYPGTGTQEIQSQSLIRPLIGVRGAVFSDWHYEATAYLSRDRFHDVRLFTDFQKTSDALNSSDPATALNPFASGAPGTPQLLSSLFDPATGTSETRYDDRIVSGQGILRGPVVQLPAGALQAVIGGEYGQEKQNSLLFGTPSDLNRNTYAVFSEARIPLLAGGKSAQADERLALTLAGRYDHSNDFGGKATWQSGLLWRATDTLSFRGGYGQSYRAPRLGEVSGPQNVFPQPFGLGIPDPSRGNTLVSDPVTLVSGPNFNLKPETGDSFTLGLEYSSQALPGLHTSLTWYDVKISNYISVESEADLLAFPNLFPGAVIRAPASPADQQQGFLGKITQLNELFYNFGDLRVGGFDADVSYAIDTRVGRFTPSVAIANVYKWQSALLPGTPTMDGVSKATIFSLGGGVGWSPRWKGTAALAWKQGPLSMNLAGRYIGRYLDYQLFVNPNTHEIGNSWIVDFNARYEAGQALANTHSWLAGSYVALGAVNLLNKTPPFSYTQYWYDIQEYDIRGRYLHLDVGLRF